MTKLRNLALNAGRHTVDFSGGRAHLMGVLNLSPESKNAPTVANNVDDALRIAEAHRRNGASIIDVGAQSSHFDNVELSAEEEFGRLGESVERLVEDGHIISIDTWKPDVAKGAIDLGATIINDTGGLQNPEMVQLVTSRDVAAVVMFLEGDSPLTVGSIDLERSLVERMTGQLANHLDQLDEQGISDVIVDPGIGISYRGDRVRYTEHQLDVVRRLSEFSALGRPVLVPVPRKPELASTLAFATLSLEYGADILRVHDVEAVAEIARLMGRLE